MPKEIYVTKADGTKQIFDPAKLRQSLTQAGAPKNAIAEIISHIESELIDDMPTFEIYRHAFSLLRSHGRPVAMRYSLRRAVAELGPSGFPFEKFFAEILKTKGFQVVTNQIVRGHCVDHEMDVVAWNADKLIMIEAKFHNVEGLKSDLKVVLYIKARFDDLRKNTFKFGDKERKLDEGWLVTNTKFSSQAIQYGLCENLTLIGWNFPEHGNLHDMIDESGLHPVTALTTLSGSEKNTLLSNGIVLCKMLNPETLTAFGFGKEKIGNILDEAKEFCSS